MRQFSGWHRNERHRLVYEQNTPETFEIVAITVTETSCLLLHNTCRGFTRARSYKGQPVIKLHPTSDGGVKYR
jgi:hypothetical protein